MTPEGYEALRSAVNVARNEDVRSVAFLRRRLAVEYSEEAVKEAIDHWANYEASKRLQEAKHG